MNHAAHCSRRRASGFIDPAALIRVKSLWLRKMVVEGFFSGMNRSPYHGFSVEFSEYRQYVPGDDLRYLDWRLYARSDRYYVKRFEDETNLRCHLLLDMSRSMGFASLSYSKMDYARTLAATFAYFLSTRRDAVGLLTFDAAIVDYVPARFRVGHLRRVMLALEKEVDGTATDLAGPLARIAERLKKRGMVILISDLLADVESLETNLGYLRARGHEVVVLHVLDPAETSFPFHEPALFRDVESGREMHIDPHAVRDAYLRRLEVHLANIRQSCQRLGLQYSQWTTDTPLELALDNFLRSRLERCRGAASAGSRGARRPA